MESGSSSLIHAILYENKACWPPQTVRRWESLYGGSIQQYCKNYNN